MDMRPSMQGLLVVYDRTDLTHPTLTPEPPMGRPAGHPPGSSADENQAKHSDHSELSFQP